MRKTFIGCFVSWGVLGLLLLPHPSLAASPKSVNQEILELLKQKNLISENQYRELNLKLARESEQQRSVLKYDRGLYLIPPGKIFQLKVNGRLEVDALTFDHGHPGNSDFTVRRAWLTLVGTAYEHFGFKLQPDFTGDNQFQDASVNINYSPQLQFRIGQFKTPFSVEWIIPSKFRDFMFMPLPIFNFGPNRDRGAILQGDLADGKLNYALGVMNGSRFGNNDHDTHKDLVGRLVFSPFQESQLPALQGLHLGGSVNYGRQNTSLPGDRNTWIGQARVQNPASGTTFFQFRDGVSQNGHRGRYGLEAVWIVGPSSIKGEWMRVQLDNLSFNNQQGDFELSGYYISLSYFLTGEEQPFKSGQVMPITPLNNFNPDKGSWGAWQLAARYERVNIDEELLSKGFADAGAYTDGAGAYTLGLTWYPNELVRIMLNYVHARFDNSVLVSNTRLDAEDTFLARFQFNF